MEESGLIINKILFYYLFEMKITIRLNLINFSLKFSVYAKN
jgi:hypothetical protein